MNIRKIRQEAIDSLDSTLLRKNAKRLLGRNPKSYLAFERLLDFAREPDNKQFGGPDDPRNKWLLGMNFFSRLHRLVERYQKHFADSLEPQRPEDMEFLGWYETYWAIKPDLEGIRLFCVWPPRDEYLEKQCDMFLYRMQDNTDPYHFMYKVPEPHRIPDLAFYLLKVANQPVEDYRAFCYVMERWWIQEHMAYAAKKYEARLQERGDCDTPGNQMIYGFFLQYLGQHPEYKRRIGRD